MGNAAQFTKNVLQPFEAGHQCVASGDKHLIDVPVVTYIKQSPVNFPVVHVGSGVECLCPLTVNTVGCATGVLGNKERHPVWVALISCTVTA